MSGPLDFVIPECEERSEARAVNANYFQIGHNEFEFLLDGQCTAAPEPACLHALILAPPSDAKGLFNLLDVAIPKCERLIGAGAVTGGVQE